MANNRLELCFRVETVESIGLYNAGGSKVTDLYEWGRHPSPYNDEKLSEFYSEHLSGFAYGESAYYFGFASMEQLRRWVYRDLDKLADIGLMTSIYQTDDYCIGDTQMVFRKSTATLIGRAKLI